MQETERDPIKRLYPSLLRVLLGQLALIIFLSGVFFVVLLANSALVGLGLSVPIILLVIFLLLAICFAHAVIVMKNQPTYLFTKKGIVAEGKQTWSYSFHSIETLTIEQAPLDFLLNTGTIVINNSDLSLFGMKNPSKIINYINSYKAKNLHQ